MSNVLTKFYLYFLSHPSSETIYIGQTVNPQKRIAVHLTEAKKGIKGG